MSVIAPVLSIFQSSCLFLVDNIGLLLTLSVVTIFILYFFKHGKNNQAFKSPSFSSSQLFEEHGLVEPNSGKSSLSSLTREKEKELDKDRDQGHRENQLKEFNIKIREQYAYRKNLNLEEVLLEMQELGLQPDTTTVNTLLDVCLEQANFEKAFDFFEKLQSGLLASLFSEDSSKACKPDIITYNTVIKGLTRQINDRFPSETNKRAFDKILQKLDEIEKHGLTPTDVTYNSIIDACVKADRLSLAFKYFDKMRAVNLTPDNITYSTLVKGIKNHHSNKAQAHTDTSRGPYRRGHQPVDEEVYDLNKVFELLTMVKADKYLKPDEILFNCVIDACVKFKNMQKALSVYDAMKGLGEKPDSVTYSTLIKGFGNMRDYDRVMEFYNRMRSEKIKMNESTYVAMIDASLKCRKADQAMEFFLAMKRESNLRVGPHIFSLLIKGFTLEKKFDKAFEVFNIMKQYSHSPPDLNIYHQMMETAIKCHRSQALFDMYEELSRPQVKRRVIGGRGDHENMQNLQQQLQPSLMTKGIFIKGLCMFGETQKALQIYQGIKNLPDFDPEEVVFSSLMHGLQKAGELEAALEIYEEMKTFKIRPTNVTYSTLIKIYSELQEVEKALKVFEESKSLYGPDLVLYNCMIQNCIRNKKMDKLRALYAEMKKEKVKGDDVFYNTIISGFAFNNCTVEAIDLIKKTLNQGMILNEEVYYNVLRSINRKLHSKSYGDDPEELSSESYKKEIDDISHRLLSKGIKLDMERAKEYHNGTNFRRKSDNTAPYLTKSQGRHRNSTGSVKVDGLYQRFPGPNKSDKF